MKGSLVGLIELQKLDRSLQALEALKGDLPQQVKLLNNNLRQERQKLETKTKGLEETKLAKLHMEGELRVFEEKCAKLQQQLYSVSNNREYDAITMEIDTVKANVDETETAMLELFEKEEELTEETHMLGPHVSDLEKDLHQKEVELKQKVESTEIESSSFERQREELAASIERRLLYQYERIRKGVGNSAVAELSRQACTGCGTTVPPQHSVEIKTMRRLYLCQSCGRILVAQSQSTALAN